MTDHQHSHLQRDVTLHDHLLIGKGKHQRCYRHPEQPGLCIKVGAPADRENLDRELNYYRHLQKRGISWRMIAAYHGPIDTNLGPGHVFDLVKDFDGSVSRTLQWYLERNDRTEEHIYGIALAIPAFKAYMLHHGIAAKNFDEKNLLYKRLNHEDGLLVLVDDIGHKDFIPVATYIRQVARAKFKRRWKRFESRLLKHHPENSVLASCFRNRYCPTELDHGR